MRDYSSTLIESYSGQIGIESIFKKAFSVFKFENKKSRSKNNIESNTLSREKITDINESIPNIKALINRIIKFYDLNGIYIVLDDFYFVSPDDQPIVIDFFNKVSKNLNVYVKVATIRNKTNIYAEIEEVPYGMELGHDIFEIDLDHRLIHFNRLRKFYTRLMEAIISRINLDVKLHDIVSTESFTVLALASGGVPRDFLNLFMQLIVNNGDMLLKNKLTQIEVREIIISNCTKKVFKLEAHNLDDSNKGKYLLVKPFRYIEKIVVEESKANIFLVSKSEIRKYPDLLEIFKSLSDEKLIHLIDNDYDRYDNKDRYLVYFIDMGCVYSHHNIRLILPKKEKNNVYEWKKSDLKIGTKLLLKELNEFIVSEAG